LLTFAACGGPAATADAVKGAPLAEHATPSGPSSALVKPDARALTAHAPDAYSLLLVTSKGDIEIAVERRLAPLGADRLFYLANNGFYNGSRFLRVVYDFVAQFGMSGIPAVDQVFDTLTLADDPPRLSNAKGTVAFAKRGPHSRSTQLFINLHDNARVLDKQQFAPVGRVVRGMDVASQLFFTYGDLPNRPGPILSKGNTYLLLHYPELDSVITMTVKR
jgi:cyclophilin family peptidyl-prolyl cis-trans isomerase